MEPLLCPSAMPAKLKTATSASDVDDLLIKSLPSGTNIVTAISSAQGCSLASVEILHLETASSNLKKDN